MTSLADTVETLREAVTQLQAALAPPVSFARVGHFTPQQETMLCALLEREIATFECLYQVLYAGRYGRDTPDDNIVKVHLVHIRRRLARYGIEIENRYGAGYRMPPADKARLRSLMAGAP